MPFLNHSWRRRGRWSILAHLALLSLLPTARASGADKPADSPAFKLPASLSSDAVKVRQLRSELRSLLRKRLKLRELPDPQVKTGVPARLHECVTDYEKAGTDVRKLTYAVAVHLRLADKLLGQEEPEVKVSGIGIAMHVCSCAASRLNDPELAATVVEAYLLPNASDAHEESWQYVSRLGVVKLATSAFLRAKEFRKAEASARLWTEIGDNQNARDAGKLALARALHEQQKTGEAIDVLKSISDTTGMAGSKWIMTRCITAILTLSIAALRCSSAQADENEDLRQVKLPKEAVQVARGTRLIKGLTCNLVELRLDGKLVGERFYRLEIPSGDVKELVVERTYQEGKLHGIEQTFHRNGKIFSEIPYRGDVVDGVVSYWAADGSALGKSRLVRGTGLWTEFNQQGRMVRENEMRRGVRHGSCREFGSFLADGGIGRTVCQVENGKLQGWCRLYDEDGTLRTESHSREGNLHGVRMSWNREGVVDAGFPKFYIDGKEVAESVYMKAAKGDPVLLAAFKGALLPE